MEVNLQALPHEKDETVTRAYLESLTTAELIRKADNWGVDIPFDLDRIFIIEELLIISSLDADTPNQEPEMKDLVWAESVPLPKQYNITFIDVMIRDPLWAFVCWEVKAQDKEQYEKAPDFEGYYLKVSLKEKSLDSSQAAFEEIFSVPVEPSDSAWYLGLRPAFTDKASPNGQNQLNQNQFKVELCAGMKGEETVLVSSNPIKLPRLPELPNRNGKLENISREDQLARLSGSEDFHIIRRNEREPRTKRSGGAVFYE